MNTSEPTWDHVRSWRVTHHHLDRRMPGSQLHEVVRNVCGIHAQVHSSAELQLWSRVEEVSPADIREALWEQRSLVRTWTLRGTLHLHTADDLPLFVSALSQHDRWWKGAWLRMIGMSESELRTTLEAIRKSLGVRPITREQLADKVAAKGGAKGDRMLSGWGEMLKPAAFHGYLCSGPPRGQNVTFVRPDRWLGKWKVPKAESAWAEIVRRYLLAYGPADRNEFARWWGMQPAAAGRVLKASGEELSEVSIEGHNALMLTESLPGLSRAPARLPVRLLAGFDPYIVGTRPREALVEKRFEALVYRQAGWISPVLLVDGRAAGVWKHERSAGHMEVTLKPFRKLSAAHRKAVTQEVDRLASFLDTPTRLSLSG